MGKKDVKDLKLKKVGSQKKSYNDKLNTNKAYLTEKDVEKIKRKKARRRFYTGFGMVSIVFILVVVLAAGSFFAWDMFAKEPTGLTLPQALSTLVQLYKDGSGVVTNPYDPEEDLNNFYADLKKGLYLSQDCEISIEDILSGVLADMIKGENAETGDQELTLANGGQLIMADETAPEIGDNGSITGNETLDKLLESLEFDFSVLEGKDQDELEREMLELNGKELAAVLNASLSSLAEVDQLKQIENEYGIKITDAVSVEQVIIDQATVLEQQDVRVLATLKLNLRSALNTTLSNEESKQKIIDKLFENSQVDANIKELVGKAIGLVPVLLPNTIYVTASVFPNQQTWNAQVIINNMDEEHQSFVNTLIDNLYPVEDGDGNTVSFMQSINAKIYDVIAKIDEIIPINFTPEDSIEAKPIQAVINMLGAENLTQGDFLALIRDVKLPTAESLGVDGYTQEAQTLAANNFINGEFSEKYYFDNVIDEANDVYFITASNLFSKLNTFSEDSETLERIKIRDRIQDVNEVNYGDGEQFRPTADYDTLAALLNGYLKNQNYKIENMEPWIMAVSCTQTGNDPVKGEYFTLEITIELDLTASIDAYLENNEAMKKLVKQLLPDSIYVFLTYTQYDGVTEDASSALVDINKKGNAMSKQHYETLMSLLSAVQNKDSSGEAGAGGDTSQISGMTFEELEAQLNDKIYQAFTDTEDNLGAEIVFLPGYGQDQGGAVLPNLFEILANNEMLRYDPEKDNMLESEFNDKYKITGAEMYEILSLTYTYDPEKTDVATNITNDTMSTGISNFVNEIDKKYYIDTDLPDDDWSINNIEAMLTKVGNEFASRLRVTGTDGIIEDETDYSQLYPYMSQYEFANLVNASGRLDNIMQIMPVSKIEYILVYIDDQDGFPHVRLRINGDISFDNVTGDGAEAIQKNEKYASLFPYDVDVIVDITVELDDYGNITDYIPSVNVNSIDDEYLDKMLFFVKRFSGQNSIGSGDDKTDFSREGLIATIDMKLESSFNDMTAGNKVDINFVQKTEDEGGIQLSTVFELAVNSVYSEAGDTVKPSGEEMRTTIKGLHSGLDDYAYSNSGYVSTVVDSDEDNSSFYITGEFDVQQGTASGTITAQFMDAYITDKMDASAFRSIIGGNEGDITFYQSYILPSYTNGTTEETGRNAQVRSYFGLDVEPYKSNSYMLITLRVVTENLVTDATNNLIPESIYINALILLESGNSQNETRLFVNNMTDEQCAIMNRILGYAGYQYNLFGGGAGTQQVITEIFETELVNYTYTYRTFSHTFRVTVQEVIENSRVWYCSLYDGTDDRRPYIVEEAGKSFDNASNRRYGLAYLRYERSEELEVIGG